MAADKPTWCGWVRTGNVTGPWRRLVESEAPEWAESLTRCHAERRGREYVVLPAGEEPEPGRTPKPEKWQGDQE